MTELNVQSIHAVDDNAIRLIGGRHKLQWLSVAHCPLVTDGSLHLLASAGKSRGARGAPRRTCFMWAHRVYEMAVDGGLLASAQGRELGTRWASRRTPRSPGGALRAEPAPDVV